LSKPVEFLATFPGIQSAIKVHGQGDGMRIQLEIPESEMASAVRLLAMREKVLRVSVETVKDNEESSRQSYI
jgi:hypothetical protein